MLTSTHKHHITSIQCPSHKCLPEKSCIHCLRILIMFWLFKDPVVIMKEIMSWLFRVQLTVTWLNLTMPNQTVKIGLKAKNIKFRRRIFFQKEVIRFSCTYELLSFYKIFKKFLQPIQSHENVPFSGPKRSICPEKFFFGANHYYYFHLPIFPFHIAKCKNILTADSELQGCFIFGPKMVHLTEKKFFWRIKISVTY